MLSEDVFAGQDAKRKIEDVITTGMVELHPEIPAGFKLDFDRYDNSIEIYFDEAIPYPWEPCQKLRNRVKACGFSMIFWNFIDGGYGKEEIRGSEPRRITPMYDGCATYKSLPGIGCVDHRFDEKAWKETYSK